MFIHLKKSAPVEPTTDYERFQMFIKVYHATCPDKLDQSSSLGVTLTSVIKPDAHL